MSSGRDKKKEVIVSVEVIALRELEAVHGQVVGKKKAVFGTVAPFEETPVCSF